jgi:MSHA biogenesis protein MshO
VTLIEMIMVIVITGILAVAVALFIRRPIEGYVDASRRAQLTDVADTALRRITRDVRSALPNSVRVTAAGGRVYVEYLATRTGGRYRSEVTSPATPSGGTTCPDLAPLDGSADENVLRFGTADTCFTSLSTVPDLGQIVTGAGGDYVVVYNLGPGIPGGDAYETGAATGGNKSRITGVAAGAGGENVFTIQANTFAFPSPARRFQVISGPVSYVCDPGAGTVRRISGYAIQAAQPNDAAAAPLSAAPQNSLLALNVAACNFVYAAVNQRSGLLELTLQISQAGESVRLFQQVHVNNAP